MTNDKFEAYGTTYHDVKKLLNSIVKKLVRRYKVDEIDEELQSQAWLTVLEIMPKYDASFNTKFTTYIYQRVEGCLKRFINDHIKYQFSQDQTYAENMELGTDSSKEIPPFEVNMFTMRPDIIFDTKRRNKILSRIEKRHADEIQNYLQATGIGGDTKTRKALQRQRNTNLSILKSSANRALQGEGSCVVPICDDKTDEFERIKTQEINKNKVLQKSSRKRIIRFDKLIEDK